MRIQSQLRHRHLLSSIVRTVVCLWMLQCGCVLVVITHGSNIMQQQQRFLSSSPMKHTTFWMNRRRFRLSNHVLSFVVPKTVMTTVTVLPVSRTKQQMMNLSMIRGGSIGSDSGSDITPEEQDHDDDNVNDDDKDDDGGADWDEESVVDLDDDNYDDGKDVENNDISNIHGDEARDDDVNTDNPSTNSTNVANNSDMDDLDDDDDDDDVDDGNDDSDNTRDVIIDDKRSDYKYGDNDADMTDTNYENVHNDKDDDNDENDTTTTTTTNEYDDMEEEEIPVDTTLIASLINDPDVRIQRPALHNDDDDNQEDEEELEAEGNYQDMNENNEQEHDLDNYNPNENIKEDVIIDNSNDVDSPIDIPDDATNVKDNNDAVNHMDTNVIHAMADDGNGTTTTPTTITSTSQTEIDFEERPPLVIDAMMRQIMLQKLNYKKNDADQLKPEVAHLIVKNNLFCPPEGVPTHWLLPPSTPSLESPARTTFITSFRRILIQRIIPTLIMSMVVVTASPHINRVSLIQKPKRQKQILSTLVDASDVPLLSAATSTNTIVNHTDTSNNLQQDQMPLLPSSNYVTQERKTTKSLKPMADHQRNIPDIDETWLDKFITMIENKIKSMF